MLQMNLADKVYNNNSKYTEFIQKYKQKRLFFIPAENNKNTMSKSLNNFKLSDLIKKKIITINANDSLTTAFGIIFNNNILSAPVIDHNRLIGSIGVDDIAVFALNVCRASKDMANYFGLPFESGYDKFEDLKPFLRPDERVTEILGLDQASLIMNYSRRNALAIVSPSSPFSEVAQLLCTNHRVAVVDDVPVELVDYITQSDLVRFFREKDILKSNGLRSIEELKLIHKEVISIKSSDKALEGFKKIIKNGVSAVAVVDENGSIVGVISAHDIKAITSSGAMIDQLYKPYHEYKNLVLKEDKLSPITVTPNETINNVIDLVLSKKIHRVFVSNSDTKLCGVISLENIIRGILSVV